MPLNEPEQLWDETLKIRRKGHVCLLVWQAEGSIRPNRMRVCEGQAPRLPRIRHGGMKRGYFHGESFERPGLMC